LSWPDFLIIGAMKAGTTSLYHDLGSNPAIFFPHDKEPESLLRDDVMTARGRQEYAGLFAGARIDQVSGEASTSYSKLPTYAGVPRRARQLLGPGLRVIYLIREPVARLLSHHDHSSVSGGMPRDVDTAVQECPELIAYSRYAMQIEPWLDTFGESQVRVVAFERYVRDRLAVTTELSEFLGVAPRPDLVHADCVYNRSEGKPVLTSAWRVVRDSWPYRELLRPILPRALVRAAYRCLLPKAPPRPAPPTAETVRLIIDRLREDIDRLPRILGLGRPPWDMEQVLARYTSREREEGGPPVRAASRNSSKPLPAGGPIHR